MSRVKIVSDGTLVGTRVVDAETGRRLAGVQAVTWKVDALSGEAIAHLVIRRVQLEVLGFSDVMVAEDQGD